MDLNEKRKIENDLLEFVNYLEYDEGDDDGDILLLGSAGMKSQFYFSDYDLFVTIDKFDLKKIVDILKRTEDNEDMFLIEIKFQKGDKKIKFRTLEELQKKYDEIANEKFDFVKLDYVVYLGYRLIELSIIYDTGDKSMSVKCEKRLKKKIGININEMKNGRYQSKEQAIAVSYSQLFKEYPECNIEDDLEDKLKIDIKDYKKEGKYYKALKRTFSLFNYRYKMDTNNKILEKKVLELSKFFNSEFGNLYVIYSNIEAIQLMMENYDDIRSKKMVELNLKNIGVKQENIEKVKNELSKMFNEEAKRYLIKN